MTQTQHRPDIELKNAIYSTCDVLACVGAPGADGQALLRPGQVLIGLLAPLIDPHRALTLAEAKVTVISLDGLPRTLSRAQSMDALSSQANVAGLQAIGTARRLGAIVTGYDVRDAARADVLSLGAKFLDISAPSAGPAGSAESPVSPVSATGAGGYARQLTESEQAAQQSAMSTAVAGFDVIITTAWHHLLRLAPRRGQARRAHPRAPHHVPWRPPAQPRPGLDGARRRCHQHRRSRRRRHALSGRHRCARVGRARRPAHRRR